MTQSEIFELRSSQPEVLFVIQITKTKWTVVVVAVVVMVVGGGSGWRWRSKWRADGNKHRCLWEEISLSLSLSLYTSTKSRAFVWFSVMLYSAGNDVSLRLPIIVVILAACMVDSADLEGQ